MAKSGWTVEDLQDMPFTLLIRHTPINIISHTRAVTQCSLKIAEVLMEEYHGRVAIDRDTLLSGALLHDVGKLFEYTRRDGEFVKSREGQLLRHPISGAAFAGRFDISQEILHIIAAHSKEGDGARRTVEAIIVNHADFVNFESLQIE
jgi:putative nucleotidyltransferase with HDIG domain